MSHCIYLDIKSTAILSPISSPFIRYDIRMARWCTVTVTDAEGRRHSLDVQANSTYDAAHLYFTHAVGHPACGLPRITVETVFEIVADGQIHRVEGLKLRSWIRARRGETSGVRGHVFRQRPTFDQA